MCDGDNGKTVTGNRVDRTRYGEGSERVEGEIEVSRTTTTTKRRCNAVVEPTAIVESALEFDKGEERANAESKNYLYLSNS